jgi:pyruvate,orthophosphate dikinase
MNLTSRYLFNEIPDEQKKIEEFGHKACNLSLAKKWQFPVPDTVFLSGELVKEIFEKKYVPAEVLSHFKNKLLAIRPSPVSDLSTKNDPFLYIGLDDQSYDLLKKSVGEKKAYEIYLSFLKMFSSTVYNLDLENCVELRNLLEHSKGLETVLEKSSSLDNINRIKQLISVETESQFPRNISQQLIEVINSIYKSWISPTQKILREVSGRKREELLPIILQEMHFGIENKPLENFKVKNFDNKTGKSSYQCLRLYKSNEKSSFSPVSEEEISKLLKFNSLRNLIESLTNKVKSPLEVSFLLDRDTLFLIGLKEVALPQKKFIEFVVSSVQQKIIEKEDGLLLINPEYLDIFLHPSVSEDIKLSAALLGVPASPGAASGRVAMSTNKVIEYNSTETDAILIKSETISDDINAMSLSKGVLTVKGGMTSHAAVIARGMGIPCIVGARNVVFKEQEKILVLEDGNVISEGDEITIDGSTGAIYLEKVKLRPPETTSTFSTLLQWASEFCDIQIRANADTVEEAKVALFYEVDGIGLCRTEHMFTDANRINLVRQMILTNSDEERGSIIERLLPIQKEDFIELFKEMSNLPVTIRLLDPPLHEFLPNSQQEIQRTAKLMAITEQKLADRIKDLSEFNPMLGTRGVRLGVMVPEIYDMQVHAIFLAAIEVFSKYKVVVNPEIMIPLISANKEVDLVRDRIRKVFSQLNKDNFVDLKYKLGVMVETPRAALRAGDIAQSCDFLSFGTNDLTQMTYGLSRDDSNRFMKEYIEKELFSSDPFKTIDVEGVGELLKIAVQRARNTNSQIVTGLCGEHGGDPSSISFCRSVGFEYISCSPYRVPIARLAAAQSRIRNLN